MPGDEGKAVKLMRLPIDTHCGDKECMKALPFGAWAYYDPDEMRAICPECGVKRGWSPKDRINQLITRLELQEDIKALRQQRKIEMDALYLLQEKIDLHRLGERDIEFEQQIVNLMNLVKDYLQHCGSASEKEALQKVFDAIRETQELQREVREQVESRLFLLDRRERKKEKAPEIEA